KPGLANWTGAALSMRANLLAWSLIGVLTVASSVCADDSATETVMLGQPDLTAGIPGKGSLTKVEIQRWLADEKNHRVLDVQLPLGLAAGSAQIRGLDKNPMTRAKIELGRQLYFDPRLSSD